MKNPVCIVMVGLPGIGKSTRVRDLSEKNPDLFVYSTDQYIETIADQIGKTYSEVFADTIGQATVVMENLLAAAMQERRDIVWDQTNLTRKKRLSIVQRLQAAGYDVQCEYFRLPENNREQQIWQQRLNSRPGKHIPQLIINRMMLSYEQPDRDEGFSEVRCFTVDGIQD